MRRVNWNSAIVIASVGAAAVILAAFITPVVSDWLTRKSPVIDPPRLVEKALIDELENISKKAEYKISSSLDARHKDLEGFYVEANQTFFDHYAGLKGKKKDGSNADLVYLMGPAGAGKSTMIRALKKNNACFIELKKEFEDGGKLSKYSVMKEDLKAGTHEFNRLPGLRDQSRFSLRDILKDGECCQSSSCKELVILDGVDELHPDLSKFLLQVIEADLQSDAKSSLPKQVLVVGRPEGFTYYLKDRTTIPYSNFKRFSVESPKYLSKGDLNLLSSELYKGKGRDTTANDQNAFGNMIVSDGWLSYTVSNLAYAGFIKEYVRLGNREVGLKLKDILFDNILEYNYESHRRPQNGDAVYVGLLEEIAAKYSEDAVKHDGYFDVPFADTVSVFSEDRTRTMGTLSTREILNRSGVVFLDPENFRTARYRFEPRWLHAYLADRWNKRVSKKQ